MKIFGDKIDSKLFPKDIKYFTKEEKSLIDDIINSILRNDKKSSIEGTNDEKYYDRLDCITEQIEKEFTYKELSFTFYFKKFYFVKPKKWDFNFGTQFFRKKHDPKTKRDNKYYQEDEQKLQNTNIITGISLTTLNRLKFWNTFGEDSEIDEDFSLNMMTEYKNNLLTKDCKKIIKNFHLKILMKAINNHIKINE